MAYAPTTLNVSEADAEFVRKYNARRGLSGYRTRNMMMIDTNDIEARLNKLAAWQYLNAATFIGVCAILVLTIL